MSEFDWPARASEIAQAPVTPTPTEPDSWLIEDLGFFFLMEAPGASGSSWIHAGPDASSPDKQKIEIPYEPSDTSKYAALSRAIDHLKSL